MYRNGCSLIICCLLFTLLARSGCKKEIIPIAFYPRSAHEAYEHSLEQANLSETALGKDWIEALESPVEIALPYAEENLKS